MVDDNESCDHDGFVLYSSSEQLGRDGGRMEGLWDEERGRLGENVCGRENVEKESARGREREREDGDDEG